MYKQFIVLLLMILLFSGCIPKRQLTPISTVKNIQTTSTVYIIRNYNHIFSGIHFYPTINGHDLAGLKSYDYIKLLVYSGEHKLGLRYYNFGWSHKEISINLQKRKSHFFLVSPTIIGTAEIEEIPEKEGQERISKSKQLPLFTISKSKLFYEIIDFTKKDNKTEQQKSVSPAEI